MKLDLHNFLKMHAKQYTLILFCGLCFNFKLFAQDESFETASPPSHWATTNGTLSTSADHYKLGTKSLKWDWSGNAVITVSNLQGNGLVRTEVDGFNFNMFRMWIYNTSAITTQPLKIEFYDDTNTLRYYYNFYLNFTGWRAASASYLYDMSKVGNSNNITTMKIKAPTSGNGTFFFDFIDYTMARNTARSADYQLPFLKLNNDEHWGDIMYFQSLPKSVPLATPSAQEVSDLAIVKQNYDNLIKGTVPSSTAVTNAITKYNEKNISYVGGIVKGNPIYGQDYPNADNIKSVDDFILIFARDSKFNTATAAASKTYFLNTVRYILDQGYADGSAMETIHHIGYSFRNIVLAIHLMKDELETAGLWTQAQKMVEWYSAVDGIWEPTAMSSNMDDANTRSISRLGACLYKTTDAEKVQYLKGYRNYIENFFTLYPKQGQGMKVDFTGFHHSAYYPGYTFLGYNNLAEVVKYLSGGQFAMSPAKRDIFKKSLLLARVVGASGDIPNSLSGRNPFDTAPIRNGLKNLGLSTPIDADVLKAYNYVYGADAQTVSYGIETPPNGFWQTNFSNLGTYRQDAWVANIKGFNKYFWGSEIYTNENRYGRYQSYGAIEVMYQGGYASSRLNIAGWDWRKTPGATTKQLEWHDLKAAASRQDELTDSNFAASLRFGTKTNYYIDEKTEGNYGIFGMDFAQKGNSPTHDIAFKFKKSVFCFDGMLICLGSNIQSATGLITTNLFQNYLNSTSLSITENNTVITTFPYNGTLSNTTDNWLIDAANTGYFVKNGNSVVIDRKNQDSPSETGNGTFTNGDFALAYISHGTAPTNQGYEYVIIPQTTTTHMATFSSNMGNAATALYEVIQKNQTAHIVKYNNIYGYALFTAGSYGTTTPIKNNDTPCLVMAQQIGETLNLSVVSPDLNFGGSNGNSQEVAIDMTLNGEWHVNTSHGGDVTVTKRVGETILTIKAKNGLPVDISLTNGFVNPNYPIIYYEDFRYDAGSNGFTRSVINNGGHPTPTSIVNRVSDVPDLTDSNNQFNPTVDRPVNRIPQGNSNEQRAIATNGSDSTTNFPIDAYAVFTTLDLTDANPLINAADTYKYASFWTERRNGEGDIATVTLLVSTNYTGNPVTTSWTALPLVSGKLAESADGLTYVKGVVDLSAYANGTNGNTVTLALRYQGSDSAYSTSNRNGTFYFSDLQFFVQSTALSVTKNTVTDDGVTVFPNPTNGILNVKVSKSNIQIKKLYLMDVSGKIIFSSFNTKEINVGAFSKGLYFLSIETNTGKTMTKKVVVN